MFTFITRLEEYLAFYYINHHTTSVAKKNNLKNVCPNHIE